MKQVNDDLLYGKLMSTLGIVRILLKIFIGK